MATLQFSEGTDSPTVLQRRKQLLPNIIDGMAETRPEAIYVEVPCSRTSYEDGYRKITYKDFANGINGVAWLLEKALGRGKNHETLCYIGPSDIGSIFMVLGAVKAGYKILLVSPWCTLANYIGLFQETECKVVVTPAESESPIVTEIRGELPIKIVHCPDLDGLLDDTFPHYSFPKTFVEARSEPLLVTHTSGTTAAPKPVFYSHDFAASCIQWGQLRPPQGFESQISLMQSNRVILTLPFFHAGILFTTLFEAIANQTTMIIILMSNAPSAQEVVESLNHQTADVLFLSPSIFEQVGKDPAIIDLIASRVKTVIYGSADVLEATGDAISGRVKVFNLNGATETGLYPVLRPSGSYPFQDWKYISPHPAAGIEFRPSIEGLYEAVIVKNAGFEDEQPVFKLFPHLTEYPTKDLFAPHLSKSGLWIYRGRADDLIALKNGSLFNPITLEQMLCHHPEIRTALVTGTGRLQSALLIEPHEGETFAESAKRDFIEQIWPIVDEANRTYPVDERVSKSHILLTNPQKPVKRTAKGTVQRRLTLKQYEHEFDELYTREGEKDLS